MKLWIMHMHKLRLVPNQALHVTRTAFLEVLAMSSEKQMSSIDQSAIRFSRGSRCVWPPTTDLVADWPVLHIRYCCKNLENRCMYTTFSTASRKCPNGSRKLNITEYGSTLYIWGWHEKKMASNTNLWQGCVPELKVLKFHTCMATFTE